MTTVTSNINLNDLPPDLSSKTSEFFGRLACHLDRDYGVIITTTYHAADAQAALYHAGSGQPGMIRTHNTPGSPHTAMHEYAGECMPASRAFNFAIFWHGKLASESGAEYQAAGKIVTETGPLWSSHSAEKNHQPGHVELSAEYQS